MQIDAHQHFWTYDAMRHSWMDDSMNALKVDYMPQDLLKVLRSNEMDGCVSVQVDQTPDETAFLLNLAQNESFIKGVVGWTDLRSPNIEAELETYLPQKKLRGFRHILQGEEDPNFMLGNEFCRGISFLKRLNYTYDILIFPHQLGAALELIKKFPEQQFVIDHLAKPYIKSGFFDGWAVLMRAIAVYPNVYCKLSGMITEADFQDWSSQQITPYMDLVLESFGTGRIMFGSDWPVCLLAGSYSTVKGLVTDYIAALSREEQAAIMGHNAISFYHLEL